LISILASESELPPAERVWGPGPGEVQAADGQEGACWLSLTRLLGWDAEVRYEDLAGCGEEVRCAIVACDPASVGVDEVAGLVSRLGRDPMLLITRVPPAGSPLAELTGTAARGERRVQGQLLWDGPGEARQWDAWPELELQNLGSDPSTSAPRRTADAHGGLTPLGMWASLGEAPLVLARRSGNGAVATLAADPAELARATPSGTGILKWLLTRGAPPPAAWLELDGYVGLRMDDPGSASTAHLDSWAHRSLSASEWRAIAAELSRRQARMTVGYVPGWVDDGDPERGELFVGGEPVERVPARIHPSPLVAYRRLPGGPAQDHPEELPGIRELRDADAGEIELHGHTHIRPPLEAWAQASDRHEAGHWYRELEGDEAAPVAEGLELLERHLGVSPTALCCPGNACSPAAAASALEAGMSLVSAGRLGIRDGERLVWSEHVRSPYLDGASGHWLEAGVPAVACLHDREPVLHGIGWLAENLDRWIECGARRLCDLRELAGLLGQRISVSDAGVVEVASRGLDPIGEVPTASRLRD